MPVKKKPAKRGKAKRAPAGRKATARKKPVARRKAPARKAAPARRKTARAKKAARPKTKRKPNPAFMKPMQPSMALSAVVGDRAIPRTEVTKKLWAYIKRNGLQDARKRTMINADDKLRTVFGGRGQVSMFEMTKLVSRHLREA